MKLSGHESMATSQRYLNGAEDETRSAAALYMLCDVICAPTASTDRDSDG
jgi:hypothetical protein